jgi:hypothetical protein
MDKTARAWSSKQRKIKSSYLIDPARPRLHSLLPSSNPNLTLKLNRSAEELPLKDQKRLKEENY